MVDSITQCSLLMGAHWPRSIHFWRILIYWTVASGLWFWSTFTDTVLQLNGIKVFQQHKAVQLTVCRRSRPCWATRWFILVSSIVIDNIVGVGGAWQYMVLLANCGDILFDNDNGRVSMWLLVRDFRAAKPVVGITGLEWFCYFWVAVTLPVVGIAEYIVDNMCCYCRVAVTL